MRRLSKSNLLIMSFSILIGGLIGVFLKSNIPSFVPVTIDSLQKMNEEKFALEKEIEEINNIIKEKENSIKELEELSDYSKKQVVIDKLDNLKISSGMKEVEGPGIIVTMRDNKDEDLAGDVDLDIVHDSDVLMIINDLKNAGAEAISINGQRILSRSEIKCGGPIIRVNGRSLGTPFTIKAIGDQNLLKASITAPNTYAYALKHVDEIDIEYSVKDKISIPEYKGTINFKYAKPSKGRW